MNHDAENEFSICDDSSCTACGACVAKCPKHAIHFVEKNQYLCNIAKIDGELCIRCGLCRKICPQNSPPQLHDTIQTVAAWLKDNTAAAHSSSGGAAQGLTKYVLSLGGVVVGAKFDDNGALQHQIASSWEEAAGFCGSKYTQSDLTNCYLQIREYLLQSRWVLVIGTPCQIAGVYAYLGKDYDTLLTANLVCHGVPSQNIFKNYVREIIGENEFSHVDFRYRNGYCFNIFSQSRKLYAADGMRDWYLLSFMYGLSYRESCYSCKYAQPKRIGDFTLGDFWGLNLRALPQQPSHHGISLLMLHTEKAQRIFGESNFLFTSFERPTTEAIAGNNQLRSPYPRFPDRERFIQSISQGKRIVDTMKSMPSLRKLYYKHMIKFPFRKCYHVLKRIHFLLKR